MRYLLTLSLGLALFVASCAPQAELTAESESPELPGLTDINPDPGSRLFTGSLSAENVVVPDTALFETNESEATGRIEATLDGLQLRVAGNVESLESTFAEVGDGTPVQVYVRGPLDTGAAGTELTSGGPEFYLEVTPDATSRGGTFEGTLELDVDQLRRLEAGNFYVAVLTERYEEGEIGGFLIPQE